MKAVFLDKDGTLIENIPYNVDPDRVKLLPGAIEGLQKLHAAGYKLIVVTNQSGVARGYFKEEALLLVHAQLHTLLAEGGVPLDGFYYCPHHPQGTVSRYAITCLCRKPAPGLVLQAAQDQGLDRGECWLVGDILDDVEAGRRSGCRTVLIDNGSETEWVLTPLRMPHHWAGNLNVAADIIMTLHESRTWDQEHSNVGGQI